MWPPDGYTFWAIKSLCWVVTLHPSKRRTREMKCSYWIFQKWSSQTLSQNQGFLHVIIHAASVRVRFIGWKSRVLSHALLLSVFQGSKRHGSWFKFWEYYCWRDRRYFLLVASMTHTYCLTLTAASMTQILAKLFLGNQRHHWVRTRNGLLIRMSKPMLLSTPMGGCCCVRLPIRSIFWTGKSTDQKRSFMKMCPEEKSVRWGSVLGCLTTSEESTRSRFCIADGALCYIFKNKKVETQKLQMKSPSLFSGKASRLCIQSPHQIIKHSGHHLTTMVPT